MKIGKKTRIGIISAGIALAVAALTLYVLACRVPDYYRPVRLSAPSRDAAMKHFRCRLMDFNNEGQKNEPFDWSLTQEQINAYLDSMDEIAMQGGAKPGEARRALDAAGLVEPAVSLEDGHVRLMARSLQYNKIVSIDIGMKIGPDGLLRVSLDGARVGQLPMPGPVVRSMVDKLRTKLGQRPAPAEPGSSVGGLDSAQVTKDIQRVIAAIDGEPISTEKTWRITTRKRIHITGIDIAGGKLTLHVAPLPVSSAQESEDSTGILDGLPADGRRHKHKTSGPASAAAPAAARP